MNRSLSSTGASNENLYLKEQVRDAAHAAVLHAEIRTDDPKWLLVDEGFTLAREHETESLFAIGNGYIGNRGSL